MNDRMQWFYISFARAKSKGGFLGATVIEADDVMGAMFEARRRGLNPGGEAQIVPIPPDRAERPEIVALRNRLVGREELIAISNGEVTIGAYHENSNVVCDECNIGER
jgi:hypothetical protein